MVMGWNQVWVLYENPFVLELSGCLCADFGCQIQLWVSLGLSQPEHQMGQWEETINSCGWYQRALNLPPASLRALNSAGSEGRRRRTRLRRGKQSLDFPPGTAGWERLVGNHWWIFDGSGRVRKPKELAALSKISTSLWCFWVPFVLL